jgi:pyruvate/2-oxoglutarate dehydrogenase complex dihydrolipoamide dehydrogenase (E3) component
MNPLELSPRDVHNLALESAVHPADWKNPTPQGRYNLVVIGAGTCGLVTAAGAAMLGARVAIVERGLMGGDCLNFGCVPSKALIRSARAMHDVREAGRFGIETGGPPLANFPAIMERMRSIRAHLSPADSADRFRSLGADVFFGDARFIAADEIEVAGSRLKFRRAAIATGARAGVPPIQGIETCGYLTNETVFSLEELPRRLAVIGAGPIGCEMAQAFARLGSQVTLIEVAPKILLREDADAAAIVEASLRRDGVEVIAGANISSANRRGTERVLTLESVGTRREIVCDQILAGVGRVPAVAGMGLEAAGVEFDPVRGIKVDDFLRTTNPQIYAAGDVASALKFTHLADAHARILIRNALFFGRSRVSALTVPWCTYTDPEIGHVGLNEADAQARGIAARTFVQPMSEVDRAVIDGETEGFVKILADEKSDRILGATIVARRAGEMIAQFGTAIANGIGLGRLGSVIHPYPTQSDAVRRASLMYARTRLTPRAAALMKAILSWRR